MVGVVVILIVVFAGMVSTTWVQFLKGSLLVIFSAVLVAMLLQQGLTTDTSSFETIEVTEQELAGKNRIPGREVIPATDGWQGEKQEFIRLVPLNGNAGYDVFHIDDSPVPHKKVLRQAQAVTGSGTTKLIDGAPNGRGEGQRELKPVGHLSKNCQLEKHPQVLSGPISFFTTIGDSEVILWSSKTIIPRPRPQNNGLLPETNGWQTRSTSRRTSEICRRELW